MAFSYPPSGSTSATISGLSDVDLSNPMYGEALTYNGTDWVNTSPNALRVDTTNSTAYYSPRCDTKWQSNFWTSGYATAIPFQFGSQISLTNWSMVFNTFPAVSGDWANGGLVKAYLYDDAGDGFTPVNLISSLGTLTVPAAPGGGYSGGNIAFTSTLGTPITLNPDVYYWVMLHMGFSNGSGGITGATGTGPNYCQSSGVGLEPLASIPVGLNEIASCAGPGGGLNCYNFYAGNFGTPPAVLDGVYPYTTYAAAAIIKTSSVPVAFLGGTKI